MTPCPCCAGTGRLPTDRPFCGCVVIERDRRPVDQQRRYAALQRVALRDIAFDDSGSLLEQHGVTDWRRPEDARDHQPVATHPMDQPPAVDLFDTTDELESWLVCNAHEATDVELLDRIAADEAEHGAGTVYDALDRAGGQLGGLPDCLAALHDRLEPWKDTAA